ncbi:hypothetical protein BD560DRAFT_488799 [Blakeslea trispora]|nr:hypothetical protein BD560DRAFT_488799 [Blakeslea trispora]
MTALPLLYKGVAISVSTPLLFELSEAFWLGFMHSHEELFETFDQSYILYNPMVKTMSEKRNHFLFSAVINSKCDLANNVSTKTMCDNYGFLMITLQLISDLSCQSGTSKSSYEQGKQAYISLIIADCMMSLNN